MKNFLTYSALILSILLMIVMVICSFAGLPVFLIFLILKLTGQITWAWIIVCIPAIAWVITVALIKFVKAIIEAIKENI